jgi:hypothetical protein
MTPEQEKLFVAQWPITLSEIKSTFLENIIFLGNEAIDITVLGENSMQDKIKELVESVLQAE